MHELGYQPCSKSYVFHGKKDYTSRQVYQMLDLSAPAALQQGHNQQQWQNMKSSTEMRDSGIQGGVIGRLSAVICAQSLTFSQRFFLPLADFEYVIANALEQIHIDPWPIGQDMRPLRCGGSALSVAVSLMEVRCSTPCLFSL